MIQEITMRLTPREAAEDEILKSRVASALGCAPSDINDIKRVRRSVDARGRRVVINLTLKVATGDDMKVLPLLRPVDFQRVADDARTVVIVGAGPAGLFAALRAIELGMRPVVLERGKDVDRRREDLASIRRTDLVNPESNYCFGEGGAGTFSDGKLFTRSKKRGNVEDILQLLHQHGAPEEILVEAHAHIGSDKLPHVIKAIRHTIERCGGHVYFDKRVDGLLIEERDATKEVCGVHCADGAEYLGPVVLATGHSARDVYRFLDAQGVPLEAKGLAIGVRLEHPQQLIDRIQYHSPQGRGKYLPAAEYTYVTQVDGRGVYSFCMCPGGVIVPAESGPDQQVVNGMSASARASRWANSGMVVEIHPEDFPEYARYGVFSMLHLQEDLERKYYEASGRTLNVPGHRMKDFVEGRPSKDLPSSSYVCGVHPDRVDKLLPPFIARRLQRGFADFGRKSPGFLTNEAMLVGLESRTSSPVRIPRDKETLSHPALKGLYPSGEGAGFAGGIVSAAIDGRRCVDAIHAAYQGGDALKNL